MAGDWIKMRTDLQKHPKVRKIASAICPESVPDKFRAIGALHAVWSLFDALSTDGSLAYYTPEALDSETGVAGIARAMESVEWLKVDPQGLSLPEFEEHNSQSAKRRAEDQKRKRNVRRTVRNLSGRDADKKRTRDREEKSKEKTTSSRPRTARTFTEDSREIKAARYLFGKLKANNPAAKEPNWQAWARAFDLIFRIDKRDRGEVAKLIDFSQSDPFWLKNILSPNALRKQFDRLTLAMKTPTKPKFDPMRTVV
jgi:hypothetical protein